MLIINGKLSLYYQIIPLNIFNYESIKTEYQCKLSVFWGLTIRSTRFFSAAQFLIRISGDSVQTLEGVFQPPCHHIQSFATPELNGILCIFQEISREHYTFLAQKVKVSQATAQPYSGPTGTGENVVELNLRRGVVWSNRRTPLAPELARTSSLAPKVSSVIKIMIFMQGEDEWKEPTNKMQDLA